MHDGASYFVSRRVAALYAHRITQVWHVNGKQRVGVPIRLKGDVDRWYRWMNRVINAEATHNNVANTVREVVDCIVAGVNSSNDPAYLVTDVLVWLPQTTHDKLDLELPALKGSSLPINLKGSLGWDFMINDWRRVREDRTLFLHWS